jgi:hypothetical protein
MYTTLTHIDHVVKRYACVTVGGRLLHGSSFSRPSPNAIYNWICNAPARNWQTLDVGAYYPAKLVVCIISD